MPKTIQIKDSSGLECMEFSVAWVKKKPRAFVHSWTHGSDEVALALKPKQVREVLAWLEAFLKEAEEE